MALLVGMARLAAELRASGRAGEATWPLQSSARSVDNASAYRMPTISRARARSAADSRPVRARSRFVRAWVASIPGKPRPGDDIGHRG